MVPLAFSKIGDTLRVGRISGKSETRRHLENLGFVEGEEITVVSVLAGNFLLNVRGSRIAIDKSMASRIFVQ